MRLLQNLLMVETERRDKILQNEAFCPLEGKDQVLDAQHWHSAALAGTQYIGILWIYELIEIGGQEKPRITALDPLYILLFFI